jgi:hypothetical protein
MKLCNFFSKDISMTWITGIYRWSPVKHSCVIVAMCFASLRIHTARLIVISFYWALLQNSVLIVTARDDEPITPCAPSEIARRNPD